MLIRVNAGKCVGIEAREVTVEVDVELGVGLYLVGLADTAVRESLMRTTSALVSVGFRIPGKKIVINLAPADLRKSGSGYDLPIAIGMLAATEQCSLPLVEDYLIMGELGLDGSVRPVPGALVLAEMAARKGLKGVIFPYASSFEATEIEGLEVYGVRNLSEAIAVLSGEGAGFCDIRCRARPEAQTAPGAGAEMDFADIVGQESAKRGMEIAAAGGHNLIMIGPPGSGKTSLAKALVGILPPMTREEALVTGKIYSVAGLSDGSLIWKRPFRTPHYSASSAALIGGGQGENIMPGEISLAHNGVLFLDEFGQIPRNISEALRGPMEDRRVVISRMKAKVEFPSSFMLVAASNPCPCGFYGEGDRCNCSEMQRERYLARLSGPIMDRMDVQLHVRAVTPETILRRTRGESSAAIARRVRAAREIQENRFRGTGLRTNAEMGNSHIHELAALSTAAENCLNRLMSAMLFSMRAYYRIIKLARTIADLTGSEEIYEGHIAEAAGFRSLDKVLRR